MAKLKLTYCEHIAGHVTEPFNVYKYFASFCLNECVSVVGRFVFVFMYLFCCMAFKGRRCVSFYFSNMKLYSFYFVFSYMLSKVNRKTGKKMLELFTK